MNKLEGYIKIDKEMKTNKCSFPKCKKKVVGATVFTEKIKGLNVDNYHFWCKEHHKKVLEGKDESWDS